MPDTAGAPDSSNGRFTCCKGVLCHRPGWRRSAGKPVLAIDDAGESARSFQPGMEQRGVGIADRNDAIARPYLIARGRPFVPLLLNAHIEVYRGAADVGQGQTQLVDRFVVRCHGAYQQHPAGGQIADPAERLICDRIDDDGIEVDLPALLSALLASSLVMTDLIHEPVPGVGGWRGRVSSSDAMRHA